MACKTLEKTPWEQPIAHMDFTKRLPTGVTITTVDEVGSVLLDGPAGAVSVTAPSLDPTGKILQVTLAGGTEDSEHYVYARTTWSDGQKREGTGKIKVRTPCTED